jgi:hypothetical protein
MIFQTLYVRVSVTQCDVVITLLLPFELGAALESIKTRRMKDSLSYNFCVRVLLYIASSSLSRCSVAKKFVRVRREKDRGNGDSMRAGLEEDGTESVKPRVKGSEALCSVSIEALGVTEE